VTLETPDVLAVGTAGGGGAGAADVVKV
jgi:hypothetical protein